MKKLLHIALGKHNTKLWQELDLQFNCMHFDWTEQKDDIPNLQISILNAFKKFKPDAVFMQIQYDKIIDPETVEVMSKTCPVYSWTGDIRSELENHFIDCAPYMTSLFTNMDDVNKVAQLGGKSEFLQVGFDNDTFNPNIEPVAGKYPPIVFLGSHYPAEAKFPLSDLRRDMVLSLKKEFGNQFAVYGGGWSALNIDENYLQSKDEASAYRTAKVCVNLSHFNSGRYSSDRLFRIMGTGGLALTHDFKGIEKDFVVGKHLATWHNIPDLIDKIKYYLSNEYEAELIRMRGCVYVRRNFTWKNFVHNFKRISDL